MLKTFANWDHSVDYYMEISTTPIELNTPLQLPYVSFLICQKGKAELTINFKDYHLKESDVLVFADRDIVIFNRQSPDFKCFYCLMTRGFASEVAYPLPTELFSYLHYFPQLTPNIKHRTTIERWIEQAQFIQKNSQRYLRIMLCNHIQNFFLILAERIGDLTAFPSIKYSRQEMICWRFWELVKENCHQERAVNYYAKQLGITPYYLSQLTQHFFIDAPKVLIDRQVILEIKRKLIQTKYSIEIIADQMNFNDPSYLGRYFKRHTNVSLTEYRTNGLA